MSPCYLMCFLAYIWPEIPCTTFDVDVKIMKKLLVKEKESL